MDVVEDAGVGWRDNAHRWFASRVDRPDYYMAVVEASGQIVSCAVGAIRDAAPSPTVPDGRDILVSNVCTAAEHRGRGYGQATFDAVMLWARQAGVGRAELIATASGRRMYERAGFQATSFPAMRILLD